MALLFTVLLTVSASILGYLLIDFGERDFLRETEAAIDIEISLLTHLERLSTTRESVLSYLNERFATEEVRFMEIQRGIFA